jgi:hypothetical protein
MIVCREARQTAHSRGDGESSVLTDVFSCAMQVSQIAASGGPHRLSDRTIFVPRRPQKQC